MRRAGPDPTRGHLLRLDGSAVMDGEAVKLPDAVAS